MFSKKIWVLFALFMVLGNSALAERLDFIRNGGTLKVYPYQETPPFLYTQEISPNVPGNCLSEAAKQVGETITCTPIESHEGIFFDLSTGSFKNQWQTTTYAVRLTTEGATVTSELFSTTNENLFITSFLVYAVSVLLVFIGILNGVKRRSRLVLLFVYGAVVVAPAVSALLLSISSGSGAIVVVAVALFFVFNWIGELTKNPVNYLSTVVTLVSTGFFSAVIVDISDWTTANLTDYTLFLAAVSLIGLAISFGLSKLMMRWQGAGKKAV